MRKVLALLAILAAAYLGLAAFRPGPAPSLELSHERPGIGRPGMRLQVRVEEPSRGVSAVRVEALQGNSVQELAVRRWEKPSPWLWWRRGVSVETFEVELGPESIEGLEEGELIVRVSTHGVGAVLRRGRSVSRELRLPVRLTPPSLSVVSRPSYATQGGSGAVVYRVEAVALGEGGRDGVQAGEWFFPGSPLPGGAPDERFALYGAPYDLAEGSEIRLVAADPVGNEAQLLFLDRYFQKPLHSATIRISDRFMAKVVPEIVNHTPGLREGADLLDSYVAINSDLRARNAATLRQLGERSRPEILWRVAFLQQPNSQVTSAFADRRAYVYGDEVVDRQDHLGFDLASVRRAPVPAANRGIVVLARYLGIYGNTVVLDHGYGLMSLYSHLSDIAVEDGQRLERGEVLGRTGETGLAAGDHLHFTLLLRGLPVNPLEWWDESWVRNRIATPLGLEP